jgi:hypothetical protein
VSQNLPSGSSHLIAGVVAGVGGATLSHPFDTIKVRMQAFIDKDHPKHEKYNTIFKTIQNTAKEGGYMSLLKGVAPRAFRITCALLNLLVQRRRLLVLPATQLTHAVGRWHSMPRGCSEVDKCISAALSVGCMV